MWIDTHCHLDAPEFATDRAQVCRRARAAGVDQLVLPAVRAADFTSVRELAHEFGLVYALGLHPLEVQQLDELQVDEGLTALARALQTHAGDPRLVAVGEIGLDFWVPQARREHQQRAYWAQLKLARQHALPVLLHVRRSADALLQGLRRMPVVGGIAHAFNGSEQQAQTFVRLGFALGFGGTLTQARSAQIRRLAATLPDTALVLETDAPDIPPAWLYATAAQRAQGQAHGRNEPAELPRIAQHLAQLRGWTLDHTALQTRLNARRVLPRLAALETAAP